LYTLTRLLEVIHWKKADLTGFFLKYENNIPQPANSWPVAIYPVCPLRAAA